jgi:hypothetical protein
MGDTTSGRRKLQKLEGSQYSGKEAKCGDTACQGHTEKNKESRGTRHKSTMIPQGRILYSKKLSSAMKAMMEEKFIRGFRKYGDKIEEKPLVNEILEEIIDLANYYITFADRAKKLAKMAKDKSCGLTTLRREILKLLT